MSSSAKSRQPRLRASCDGCFLAKVKCSKARPICSRCLACGIECRYSPSSRAGKPKSDAHASHHASAGHDLTERHRMGEDTNMTYNTRPSEHLFKIETGWTTPPTSVDGSMSRNPSISTGLSLMGVEEQMMNEHDSMSAPPEMYPASMPWTPPTDLSCAPYGDVAVSVAQMPGAHVRSQSFDLSMTAPMGWSDPSTHDMMAYSHMPTPSSMPSNYFPSPTATPHIRPASSRHKPSSSTSAGGSCNCFTVCLQSLQHLHNASGQVSPPFDLVLSLNRKAVEGCAAMLSCSKCMNRSGTHTAAMLLATVMGKITSFYRNASHSYFENGSMGMSSHSSPPSALGVSLGAYQLNSEDGRWLELEILARELRKLEEVYARFREVFSDLSDDPEVSKAMIGYLGQNLGSTLEVISHRKGDVTYA
ncbi:uncharacterized protein BCR38DRAFT_340734 [Pseudomassariella vexata]|uniref:Zn(2)-C6 fungal-type domain-containing protein n=1 Tax=Pseudomassariella vexata TaxID=1141098 RepID=A0A1Y2E1D3_9PEZI|nr:uncharacterized protein BCR38DRAFT_340734 [Pseudomassariella vexata]ORY65287.1 hypothetical protein BCR38DRAFT_340734 [Pseudomassariella vexata]